MHGAHCKHSALIPHQFSITNLILLICGCMCTKTPGHIPRHTSRTSSNNNIIIWLHSTWLSANTMLHCFIVINLCLYDLCTRYISCYMGDCMCMPLGFILRTVAFWQPWTCMSKSRSLERGGPFHRGPNFSYGASASAVAHSVLFSWPARRIFFFCSSWASSSLWYFVNHIIVPLGDVILI